jgi:hypothetical protein
MQIRRLNGGRLAGVRALLKATPERVCYKDRSGINHTTVVYILSFEVGGRDLLSVLAGMDETAKLFQQGRSPSCGGAQYIVQEAEAERAPEIAGEFYPNGDEASTELAETSVSGNADDEVVTRVCELAQQLGYNRAKTKMLLGQWATDLLGLERSLLKEIATLPEKTSNPAATGYQEEPTIPEGFLFFEDRLIRRYE